MSGRLALLVTPLRALTAGSRRTRTNDAIAGVTVAAFLVPQVMAYSGVAGLQPIAGLRAALPALALYALLGTSRVLSVGPESTTALMTAVIVGPLAAHNSTHYAALCAMLALIVGGYSVLASLAKCGFVADLLSQPILVGYLAGLAVTVLVEQLGRVTGVPQHGSTVLGELTSWLHHLDDIQGWWVALSVITIALASVQLIAPRIPGPLLAVLVTTGIVSTLGLTDHGVTTVGPLPTGVPAPTLPTVTGANHLLLPAFGVLLVAYTDTVVTGRSFAGRHDDAHQPSRELFALGASNIGAGLFGGFPVGSSASRTALAAVSGATSQLYSLVCFAAVLGVMMFAGPLLAKIPVCALGGLVVYAAVRLIQFRELQRLARFRWRELALALATAAGVIITNPLTGVLIAVGLSVAEMLLRIARPHDAVLGQVPDVAGMHDIDDYPDATQLPGLVVYRYDSPLFFANAEDFKTRALHAADSQRTTLAWFILNVEANVEVDITALDALEEVRRELTDRGVVVGLARVKQDLLVQLQRYGLAASIGAELMFPTLPTAVGAFETWRAQQNAETTSASHPAAGSTSAADR